MKNRERRLDTRFRSHCIHLRTVVTFQFPLPHHTYYAAHMSLPRTAHQQTSLPPSHGWIPLVQGERERTGTGIFALEFRFGGRRPRRNGAERKRECAMDAYRSNQSPRFPALRGNLTQRLMWFCVLLARLCLSFVIIEEEPECGLGNVLFVPERLLPYGSSEMGTLSAWREASHLRPQVCFSRSSLPSCYCLIILAGDIEINPGPGRYPCTVCERPVKSKHKAVECSRCEKWTHDISGGISPGEIARLNEEKDDLWYCPDCLIEQLPLANASLTTIISTGESEKDGALFGINCLLL